MCKYSTHISYMLIVFSDTFLIPLHVCNLKLLHRNIGKYQLLSCAYRDF